MKLAQSSTPRFKLSRQAAAVIALSACGATHAESSVTLFGGLDANVGRYTGSVTGVNATDKAIKRVDSGGMTTSFWGVRGTEDLGDNSFVNFELTSFIRNDTGTSGRSDAIGPPVNVAADPMFARNAWVGFTNAHSAASVSVRRAIHCGSAGF